jgi:hypothetical protein
MHDSFNSHDVLKKAQELVAIAQKPVICENCGTVLATLTNGWNCWFNGGIGVPGSPDLAAFSCDSGQHWACSLDCWQKIAHACIDEHLAPTMQGAHNLLLQRQQNLQRQVDTMKEESNVNSSDKV